MYIQDDPICTVHHVLHLHITNPRRTCCTIKHLMTLDPSRLFYRAARMYKQGSLCRIFYLWHWQSKLVILSPCSRWNNTRHVWLFRILKVSWWSHTRGRKRLTFRYAIFQNCGHLDPNENNEKTSHICTKKRWITVNWWCSFKGVY